MPLLLPPCRKTDFNYIVRVNQSVERLYVNVWLDFNRDGDWDDVIKVKHPDDLAAESVNNDDARAGLVREWAVNNQLLTGLTPGIYKFATPPFVSWHPPVTDDIEYAPPIWMRITISESPLQPAAAFAPAVGYAGSGPSKGYWIGETEDYFFTPILHCRRSADLNCDNVIDLIDLSILTSQWMDKSTYEVIE